MLVSNNVHNEKKHHYYVYETVINIVYTNYISAILVYYCEYCYWFKLNAGDITK